MGEEPLGESEESEIRFFGERAGDDMLLLLLGVRFPAKLLLFKYLNYERLNLRKIG